MSGVLFRCHLLKLARPNIELLFPLTDSCKLDSNLVLGMWIIVELPTKYYLSHDLRVASFSSEAKLHRHRSGDK